MKINELESLINSGEFHLEGFDTDEEIAIYKALR